VLGQIVVLNGPPRAGKSSIVAAVQSRFEGVWMNLGVDGFMSMTPARFRPGIGLRPGGERPDLEPVVTVLYRGLYESIAVHSRLGVNVVVDVGHHDAYSEPLGILRSCAEILRGLPVLFAGVDCPIDVARDRRRATWGGAGFAESAHTTDPVALWHRAVHDGVEYDLDLDTSKLTPEECAEQIRKRLETSPEPTAFHALARPTSFG
jgi:chloramphenicol 3-O phosphotransferase